MKAEPANATNATSSVAQKPKKETTAIQTEQDISQSKKKKVLSMVQADNSVATQQQQLQ